MAGDFLQRSRHGTTYFFRRRVPQDVQHILKLTQVFRSLATADRREAIVRARVLATHTDRLFTKLRMAKKNKPDLVRTDYILLMEADELGLPRLKLQTETHDTPADKEQGLAAFKEATQTIMEAQQQIAVSYAAGSALKPGMPLCDAVDSFLEAIKNPKTFRTYRTGLREHAISHFGGATLVY